MNAKASTQESENQAPALSVVALDDDADFRQYISELLESQGHTVSAVASQSELFAEIERQMPDLMLLDMNMGRERGEEVLAAVRQSWPKLVVVVLTGHPSLESMRQTFKQDVYDYLAKPFEVDELKRVLAQATIEFGLGGRPQDRLREELGRQIRITRTEHGWTLKDLSEHSGVSVSQLSSIERGAHLPSVESLLTISIALQARPSTWLAAAGF